MAQDKGLTLRIIVPRELHRAVRLVVAERGSSNREIIIEALRQHPHIKKHLPAKA
jgi:hypothetical protein